MGIFQHGMQGVSVQGGDIFLGGDSFLRKHCHKGVLHTPIIPHEARGLFVFQISAHGVIHKVCLLLCPVRFGEGALLHLGLVIGRKPFCLKGKGVHQIHHCVGGDLIQNVLDHAVGFQLHPFVDVLTGLLVKGSLIGIRIVVILYLLQKFPVHRKPFILGKPNRVGKL